MQLISSEEAKRSTSTSRGVTAMSTIGVPTKLLQESLGHVVTIELKTGQVYRGKLFEG